MVVRTKWFVDRKLEIHENAEIKIGSDDSSMDLGDSILMPGLVNAHCHLDYTDMRDQIPPQNSFGEWISRINKLKQTWKDEDYIRSIDNGLNESLRHGTTTMANWICFPKLLSKLKVSPMRLWWLWEQIAFRSEVDTRLWKDWSSRCSVVSPFYKAGLAPHAPYTCSAPITQKAAAWSRQNHLPWSIHVGESNEEYEMFHHQRGVMFDIFKNLGRDMTDCGGKTPLATLQSEITDLKSLCLLIHANRLDDSDFVFLDALKDSSKKNLSVVHCPRSHEFFQHASFRYEDFRKAGINVCLGTDSLASNKDLSMFCEMNTFVRKYPKVGAREVVAMVTVNGARALGMEREWNDWQDWIAIPCKISNKRDVFQAITSFTGLPNFVTLNAQHLE